jgi:hypothetical protein
MGSVPWSLFCSTGHRLSLETKMPPDWGGLLTRAGQFTECRLIVRELAELRIDHEIREIRATWSGLFP